MDPKIYQIYYDENSRSDLIPGFIPLDNTGNERPDWREYWPIRKYFSRKVEQFSYLGFFSPKFYLKTNLNSEQVKKFVSESDADVISFAPFIDQSAFFKNIFEHGEANHPGLLRALLEFLNKLDIDSTSIGNCVPHEYFLFSNFFVAKERFWHEWRFLADALFDATEYGASRENLILNKITRYRGGENVALRVFVMERLASLVLHLKAEFTVECYPSFSLPAFGSLVSKYPAELAISNALKAKFHASKEQIYLSLYESRRTSLLNSLAQSNDT